MDFPWGMVWRRVSYRDSVAKLGWPFTLVGFANSTYRFQVANSCCICPSCNYHHRTTSPPPWTSPFLFGPPQRVARFWFSVSGVIPKNTPIWQEWASLCPCFPPSKVDMTSSWIRFIVSIVFVKFKFLHNTPQNIHVPQCYPTTRLLITRSCFHFLG